MVFVPHTLRSPLVRASLYSMLILCVLPFDRWGNRQIKRIFKHVRWISRKLATVKTIFDLLDSLSVAWVVRPLLDYFTFFNGVACFLLDRRIVR